MRLRPRVAGAFPGERAWAARPVLGWVLAVLGLAAVGAPVRAVDGTVIAAVSISGPIERVSRQPGRLHAATVVAGANKLTEVLARAHAAQQQAGAAVRGGQFDDATGS